MIHSTNRARLKKYPVPTIASPVMKYLLLPLLLLPATSANADSLWKKRSDNHAFLFIDSKARHVGDLLTVVVTQATDVNSRENRGLGKSSDATASFSVEAESGGGFATQASDAALNLTQNSSRNFDGNSSFQANQVFTDRMTVTVMDVLPNGNLIVSGQRRIRVAGDERTLQISGVVRSIDIGGDNEIESRMISQLRLLYETAGPSQRFTRQGWWGRARNKIWPF